MHLSKWKWIARFKYGIVFSTFQKSTIIFYAHNYETILLVKKKKKKLFSKNVDKTKQLLKALKWTEPVAAGPFMSPTFNPALLNHYYLLIENKTFLKMNISCFKDLKTKILKFEIYQIVPQNLHICQISPFYIQ